MLNKENFIFSCSSMASPIIQCRMIMYNVQERLQVEVVMSNFKAVCRHLPESSERNCESGTTDEI
jgi:hypothetical protein